MKRSLILLFVLFFSCTLFAEEEGKNILILNSFREDIYWADHLAKRVSNEIKGKYPEASVYLVNLSANKAQRIDAMYTNLRAGLQSMNRNKEFDATILTQDQFFGSLDVTPDLVIVIGEEAWNTIQRFLPWMGKYTKVPTLLTAVTDSIYTFHWSPGYPVAWEVLKPTSETSMFYTEYINKIGDSMSYDSLIVSESHYVDSIETDKGIMPIDIYRYSALYNVTSLIIPDLTESTIGLMKDLIPDLKEIIFVDNKFLTALQYERKFQMYIAENHPEIDFKSIYIGLSGVDSLYNIMLENAPGRAILTHSFEIDPTHSRRARKELDSLFNNELTTPIFSIMRQRLVNNYLIGGTFISDQEYIEEVMNRVVQIFSGTNAIDIPPITLPEPKKTINETALYRFNLQKNFIPDNNTVLQNLRPSFFAKYELRIYAISLFIILCIGFAILMYRKGKHNRKLADESKKYRRLYDELNSVYENTTIDFAIYDEDGNILIKVNNNTLGKNFENDLLSDNLFKNTYLSKDQIKEIKKGNELISTVSISGNFKTQVETMEKYEIMVSPLDKRKYENARYSVVLIDLTPMIKEREEREKIERLLDFASETFNIGIAYYNLINGEGFANDAWYINLNESRSEKIRNEYNSVSSVDRVPILDIIKKMRTKETEPFQRDIRIKKSDGTYSWIKQYIFQTKFEPDNNEITIVELNINIDTQKISEIELVKAQKEAEQSNRETEEFLANISHEIRTPLNAIVGFSSLLVSIDDPEEVKELSFIIQKNNQLLLQLINDIVELSKSDSGRIEFNITPIELNSLIESLSSYAKKAMFDKALEIKIDMPEDNYIIRSDKIYLTHIFHHLISNSVKFTEEGSITIGYFVREQNFYFFVEDTGTGIPKDKQNIIFKRFEKLNPFIQGSGLGLSLCKSIVSSLGGEIGVISTPNKGSKFWFILPR